MNTKITKALLVLIIVAMVISGCNVQVPEQNVKTLGQANEGLPVLRYVYEENGESVLSEDFDDFIKNTPEDTQIQAVFCLKAEEIELEARKNPDLKMPREQVEEIISGHHARQKAYHESRNYKFLEENGFSALSEDYEVINAVYSPFMLLVFENVTRYEKHREQIEACKDAEIVAWIWIGIVCEEKNDATRVDPSTASNYNMTNVLSDIGATDQTYKGYCMNIGVLESGGVIQTTSSNTSNTPSHPELSYLTVYRDGPSGSCPVDTSGHAERVIRTLCGTNGIARNVYTVYNYYTPNTSDNVTAMAWLISSRCYLVNKSGGAWQDGKYHWLDAFMDYQVRNNCMTLVKSAGNISQSSNEKITSPGVGYNVITVGASDSGNNVSSDSSFGVNTASGTAVNGRKPTLVAPGVKIQTAGYTSGTSYAAPIVTGVLAKLSEEFTGLALASYIATSALCASATFVNGQGTVWDTHAGAGRVNYAKAQQLLNNYTYGGFSSGSLLYAPGTSESIRISIATGKKLNVIGFWYSNSEVSTPPPSGTTIPLNIHTNYYLYVKTTGGNTLASSTSSANMQHCYYNNTSYTQLDIVIYLQGPSALYYYDYGAYAWFIE